MKRKEANFLEYITWSELGKLKLRPERSIHTLIFAHLPPSHPLGAGVTAPRPYDLFLLIGKNEQMKYFLLL